MKLLTQNSKIKKNKRRTFNFGIPAYKSVTGLITCPMAKDCIKGCYARQGAYQFGNVKNAYEQRLDASLKDDFPLEMVIAIIESQAEMIRIHDSGDFYSREYLDKWLKVMDALPHVEFYCYTKRVSLLRDYALIPSMIPANFKIIFSYGGTQDHLIGPNTMRHSRVFKTKEEMKGTGYIDASENDELCLTSNHKIGLVYHGHQSRSWNYAKV